jgi:hypothetical protein
VTSALLGDQDAACALTRAKDCPVPGHPCLDGLPHARVLEALDRLTAASRPLQEVPA